MIKTILITGGTGFVGTKLTELLLQSGYTIHMLVRDGKSHPNERIKSFNWDVYNGTIDGACVRGVDAIIHLAGEEIAGKRWTDSRKKQIVESRTESIRLIYQLLKNSKHQVSHVISASAIGYYGNRQDEILSEDSLPGKDFLAETCIEWETAVTEGESMGLRVVLLRTGLILDKSGGAFPAMTAPFKMGFAIIPGNGKQWVSWIHLQDVLTIYQFALESENLKGAYNMAAPEPVQMKDLLETASKTSGKVKLIMKTPAIALRLALGEMSLLALSSTRVKVSKIQRAGFKFKYAELKPALEDILRK